MAVTDYYMVIGESTNGVRTDYLCDALGSVTATVDQMGAVLNTYRYRPYGGLLAKTGVAPDPGSQWCGGSGYRRSSSMAGYAYVRARHLSFTSGMWTSQDPLWPGESAFGYLSSNPVSNTDQTGVGCPGNPPVCKLSSDQICQIVRDKEMLKSLEALINGATPCWCKWDWRGTISVSIKSGCFTSDGGTEAIRVLPVDFPKLQISPPVCKCTRNSSGQMSILGYKWMEAKCTAVMTNACFCGMRQYKCGSEKMGKVSDSRIKPCPGWSTDLRYGCPNPTSLTCSRTITSESTYSGDVNNTIVMRAQDGPGFSSPKPFTPRHMLGGAISAPRRLRE